MNQEEERGAPYRVDAVGCQTFRKRDRLFSHRWIQWRSKNPRLSNMDIYF
jgi:hypothetical protein